MNAIANFINANQIPIATLIVAIINIVTNVVTARKLNNHINDHPGPTMPTQQINPPTEQTNTIPMPPTNLA